MSRPSTKKVEFYYGGELVRQVTDTDTARAVEAYNGIYNKIDNFKITKEDAKSKRSGFIRTTYTAVSSEFKIRCIKEYVPGVSKFDDGASYECDILNTKTNKLEVLVGGVPAMYYKLFSEHAK